MDKHTELRVTGWRDDNGNPIIATGKIAVIEIYNHPDLKDKAEFADDVVKAVNNHKKLLKALKEYDNWAMSLPDTDTVVWHPPKDLIEKTHQAIQEAEK